MNEPAVAVIENSVTSAPQNETWGWILYCVIVFAVIYFLMVRPQKKRMAEYEKMLASLKVGNRVMAAGIYGTIKRVDDQTVDVEIAKGVVIQVNKRAVSTAE